MTLALPMSYRNDFGEDLENAAVLRLASPPRRWPRPSWQRRS